MRHTSLTAALLLALLGAPVALAKAPPTRVEAQALMKAEDYKGAAKALGALAKEHPEDGGIWLDLGLAQLRLEKFDDAAASFARAQAAGVDAWLTQYNLACTRALQGDVEAAFTALDAALDAGFHDVGLLKTDPDLASLRGDARIKDAVEAADRNAHPCEIDDRWAAVDFWVGTWTVTNPAGEVVGTNTLEKALRGCVLTERWQGSKGMAGLSLTTYDPAADLWRQTWVDEGGSMTLFEGGIKAGALVLEGESTHPDGMVYQARMTVTPNADGTVTQLGERSKDGQTWKTTWTGTYTRAVGPR